MRPKTFESTHPIPELRGHRRVSRELVIGFLHRSIKVMRLNRSSETARLAALVCAVEMLEGMPVGELSGLDEDERREAAMFWRG